MSLLACLEQPAPASSELMFSAGLFNVVAAFVLVSVFVAACVAPLVRAAYRARVKRLMGLNQVQPRPDRWWQTGAARNQPNRIEPVLLSAEDSLATAKRSERRIARATAAAWLAFVLFAPWVLAWSDPSAGWVSRLEFAVVAGLLALGPALVNLPLRWRRVTGIAAIVALIALFLAVSSLQPETVDLVPDAEEEDWPAWVYYLLVGFAAWVYLSMFRQRIRGQVIPLAFVSAVFALVFALPLGLLEPYLGSCLTPVAEASGAAAGQATFSGLAGATLSMIGLWAAFRVLGVVAGAIERGWIGELSMVSLVGLGVVASTLVLGITPEDPALATTRPGWLSLSWFGLTAAVYVVFLGRTNATAAGLPLLMLRVFSADKRKHDLLHQIQERWRYFGAVDQAGGPDLIDFNVGPYACAKFMGGSLHDLYLPEAVSGDKLMGRFNHSPDREGRYRINEMFNFNTSWRGNVEQLILNSQTILLDVRGLTAEREGTSFEVGLLARHALLGRVVAVGDGETDWAHIGGRLAEHGRRLEELSRCEVVDRSSLDQLIDKLLQIPSRKGS